MLRDRLLSSAILIIAALTLIYMDARSIGGLAGGVWLLPLMFFFGLGTAWDASTMLKRCGRGTSRRISLLGASLVMLGGAFPALWEISGATYPAGCPVGRLGWITMASIGVIFLTLGVEMYSYGKASSTEKISSVLDRACTTAFVSLYAGIPLALLGSMRSLGEGTWGLAALLSLIIVTKSSDAGAYFTGKALGRHKLIPRLSPGKTWEGAVGGVLTSTIVAFACLHWLFPALTTVSEPAPWYGAWILGPVLAICGMVGDLAESLIKRECGVKDSGSWLPGLGGVWDVSDSLLAAVMPGFLCFAAGLAGK